VSTKNFDFTIVQGSTHDITVEFYDDDNLPRTLTGNDFKLDCKQHPNSPEIIFSLSSVSGQITVDGTNTNMIHLILDHTTTKGMSFTKGFYDMVMYDSTKANVEVLMSGTCSLVKTITRLP